MGGSPKNAFRYDEKRVGIKGVVIMDMSCINFIHDLAVAHGKHAQLTLNGLLCGN